MNAANLARVFVAIVTCSILGMPSAGFPALRSFFMNLGLYEDLCQVHANQNIHCLARQLQFDKLFAAGALGTGLGGLVGYFAVDIAGVSLPSVAGGFLLALGSSLMGTDMKEDVGFDHYRVGYSLLCFGAPFVLFSSIDATGLLEDCPLPLAVLLLSIAQLSSILWGLAIKYFEPQTPMDLFNRYLCVPAFLIVANVLLAPLCTKSPGGAKQLAKRIFNSANTFQKSNRNNLPLLEHNVSDLDESFWSISKEPDSGSKIGSQWFVIIFIFYATNMLVMDGYLSSGPEYAWSVNEAPSDVILFQSIYAPIATALAVIATGWAFLTISHFTILCFTGFLCASCPVLLIFGFWKATSILMSINRILLQATAVDYCVRVFGTSSLGYTFGLLNLFTSFIVGLMPVLDSYILTYEGPSRNLLISITVIQTLGTFISLRMFVRKCTFIDRQLLRREAEDYVYNSVSL